MSKNNRTGTPIWVKKGTKISFQDRRKLYFQDDSESDFGSEISNKENIQCDDLLQSIQKLSLKKNHNSSNYFNKIQKNNIIRITKSEKVFYKKHKFLKVLAKPSDNGTGCYVYISSWDGKDTITKLLPIFEDEEFSAEENEENALREYRFHSDLYRNGCKQFGINKCPVCPLIACITLKHFGKDYLALVMPKFNCNLREFIEMYGELRENEALDLLKTGLNFLKLCHENKIVHNDIKPENIFLNYKEIWVIQQGRKKKRMIVDRFVFGDFGCSVCLDEEFPFGPLTGTLTMWDAESLGNKHGHENGCSIQNDIYGFIGSLFDGVMGVSFMEMLLDGEDEGWEDLDWNDFTDLLRKCRRYYKKKMIHGYLKKMEIKNSLLQDVVLQLTKPRDERMNLDRLRKYVEKYYKLYGEFDDNKTNQ